MKRVRRDAAAPRGTNVAELVGQLPTDRCITRTQLEFLDVMHDLAQAPAVIVRAEEISGRTDVSAATICEAMSFMAASGLVHRGRRAWALTDEGAEVAQLRLVDEAQPRLFLNHLWRNAGFAKAARVALAAGPLDPDQLAYALVGGNDGRLSRGHNLVDWLAYALHVHRRTDGKVASPAGRTDPPRPSRAIPTTSPRPDISHATRLAAERPTPRTGQAAPMVGEWLLEMPVSEAHSLLDAYELLLKARPTPGDDKSQAV